MARVIQYYAWDDVLQDVVRRPLDDADSWTISLARHVNGKNLTDEQFRTVLRLHAAEFRRFHGIDN